jgi:putative ATPase
VIDLTVAEESIQRRAVLYDKEGDVHYDTISAFIKSLRGSDPDAALYWMAKMVYAGEDARFIFRRMAILAGEDVGMADPNAAVMVAGCWELYERIGMPEGRFPLAQAALYLATCPKSNSTLAFFDALTTVEKEQEAEVPNHLRDGNRDKEGFGHGKGYLYPHAYRDHWVVQQYLPAALQGKLFYEPSDQGYERGIRTQVARRREEQLAAMVEQDSVAPEVLTTSPVDKVRDAWLQRTIANSGRNLGLVRDRVFELAAVQRHHLILDLNAATGLLTWEAIRQAPEGGVWAMTAEMQAGEALRQQAERLPELERPVILVGELNELDYLLALRGEETVRFDRIIGRNAFTRREGWEAAFAQLAGRLLPDGRLVMAQTVPRLGQRLYKLVDWSKLPAALAKKVAKAEEAIYHDPVDPLVNWEVADLAAALESAGFSAVEVRLEKQVSRQRISPDQLARWFSEEGEKASYGQRLQEGGIRPKELERVEELYRRQLREQLVDWETGVVLVAVAPLV